MRALCVLLAIAMAHWTNENAYDGIVAQASARHGVPASLIKAIIAAESGFNPGAVRREDFTGRTPPSDWPEGVTSDASRGLMQVLCWRAQWLGYGGDCDGLFDPYTNIMAGTKLLATNAAQLGNWTNAISAYNGGIRPALGFGKPMASGKYANQSYVNKVRTYWLYFETGEWQTAGFGRAGVLAAIAIAAAALGFFGFVAPLSVGRDVLDGAVIFAAGGAWYKLHYLGERIEKLEERINAFVAR